MKKLVALLVVMMFVCTPVFAGGDPNFTKTYETRKGNVTFNHQYHVDRLGIGSNCSTCHDMFTGIDKGFGHKVCKACHKATNDDYDAQAPLICTGCHKK